MVKHSICKLQNISWLYTNFTKEVIQAQKQKYVFYFRNCVQELNVNVHINFSAKGCLELLLKKTI